MKFEDIDWHDQLLTEIRIDRKRPGQRDCIEIDFEIDGKRISITFNEVYQAELNMNFGIDGEETIRYGYISNKGIEIERLQNKWNKIGVELNELKCFEFNTNSTNSLIKIYALYYQIKEIV